MEKKKLGIERRRITFKFLYTGDQSPLLQPGASVWKLVKSFAGVVGASCAQLQQSVNKCIVER